MQRKQRRMMLQREQAERARQRTEQKIKQNELQQQLAAKKERSVRSKSTRFVKHLEVEIPKFAKFPSTLISKVDTKKIISVYEQSCMDLDDMSSPPLRIQSDLFQRKRSWMSFSSTLSAYGSMRSPTPSSTYRLKGHRTDQTTDGPAGEGQNCGNTGSSGGPAVAFAPTFSTGKPHRAVRRCRSTHSRCNARGSKRRSCYLYVQQERYLFTIKSTVIPLCSAPACHGRYPPFP